METYDTARPKEQNFFDVEREFFLIDSEHLDKVETRFYGYSVQRTGIYEEDNLTEEAIDGLDGRGCYVYVEANERHISIRQDFCGCYGIYLFRQGDYFALSSSFLRLLQHVSRKYPLTVNKDYGHHLLIDRLASQSPTQTPVKEISIIDRWARLSIDTEKRSLSVDMLEYKEMSYSLDTPEGIVLLDEWFDFWTDFLKELSKHTDYLRVDLSGGYDSRLTFLLMLCSGADLNALRVNSTLDKLHTHAEDYQIASSIAEHYGFSLNRPYPQTKWLNYSQADCINIEAYTKLGFHKEPYIKNHISADKFYTVMGSAGEAIRERYTMDAEAFIKSVSPDEGRFATKLEKEAEQSIRKVIEEGYRLIEEKYGKPDKSNGYPQRLYRDGWTRSHFGKMAVVNRFAGNITLMPLLDPILWKLKLHTKDCDSDNLLMALIYARYCPRLMEFPFEGRLYSITVETAEVARKLNERFPRSKKIHPCKAFVLKEKNERVVSLHGMRENNREHLPEEVNELLKKTFDSSEVRGLFTSCFDEQFYEQADLHYHWDKFFPLRHCSSVLGLAETIKYAIASQLNGEKGKSALAGSLHSCAYLTSNRLKPLSRFRNNIAARLDFKIFPGGPEDLDVITCSDDMAKWSKPQWLQKSGGGLMLHSSNGELMLTLNIKKDGELHLWLRGVDVREPEDRDKRVPYWLDFKNLFINGKAIFTEKHMVWHDQPFEYKLQVKAGEEIAMKTEWSPHQGR